MSTSLSAFLRPPMLSVAELSAARLDGELFAIDTGYCCIDEPDTVALRIEILADVAAAPATFCGMSAAWLCGALAAPPPVHETCANAGERTSTLQSRTLHVRQLVVDPGDLVAFGPYRRTSAVRTAADLARDHPIGSPGHRALCRIIRSGAAPEEAVVTWLHNSRGFQRRSRALSAVEAAADATLPGLEPPPAYLAV